MATCRQEGRDLPRRTRSQLPRLAPPSWAWLVPSLLAPSFSFVTTWLGNKPRRRMNSQVWRRAKECNRAIHRTQREGASGCNAMKTLKDYGFCPVVGWLEAESYRLPFTQDTFFPGICRMQQMRALTAPQVQIFPHNPTNLLSSYPSS